MSTPTCSRAGRGNVLHSKSEDQEVLQNATMNGEIHQILASSRPRIMILELLEKTRVMWNRVNTLSGNSTPYTVCSLINAPSDNVGRDPSSSFSSVIVGVAVPFGRAGSCPESKRPEGKRGRF